DIATISQPGKEKSQSKRNGTRGGTKRAAAIQTNYYHPLLWTHINRTICQTGWSTAATAKALQRDYPCLFSKLQKGTIHKWK
ncbi:hypothetical protein C8J56DRAFT_741132, partial [Mycena floridula]